MSRKLSIWLYIGVFLISTAFLFFTSKELSIDEYDCAPEEEDCRLIVTATATGVVPKVQEISVKHRERICLSGDDCYEGVNLPDTGEPGSWRLCPDGADCLQKGEVIVWGVRAHLGEHILDRVYSCDRNMENCVEVLPNEDGLFCFDDGSCVFPLETLTPNP